MDDQTSHQSHWCKEAVMNAQQNVPSNTTPSQSTPQVPPNFSSLPQNLAYPSAQNSSWNVVQHPSQLAATQYAASWAGQQAQVAVQQYVSKLHATGEKISDATFQHYYQYYYNYYYQHYYQSIYPQGTPGASTITQPPVATPLFNQSQTPTYASVLSQGSSTTTSLQAAAVAKKPNMSRFSVTTTGSQESSPHVPSPSNAGSQKPSFPPSLNQFMIRCFETCKNDQDRDHMKAELKKLVDRVQADGRLLKHDWVREPTPRIHKTTVTTNSLSVDTSSSSEYGSKTNGEKAATAEENNVSPSKRKKSRWADAETDRTKQQLSAAATASSSGGSSKTQSGMTLVGTKEKYLNLNSSTTLDIWGSTPGASEKKSVAAKSIVPLNVSSEEMKMRERRANRFLPSDNDSSNSTMLSLQSSTSTNSYYTSQDTALKSEVKGKGKANNNSNNNNKKSKKRGRLDISDTSSTISKTSSSSSLNNLTGGGMTDEEMNALRIVGTCSRLEKDYFRLTSAPDPSTVRPEVVLRKTLKLLKAKWDDEGDDSVDYVYICNQLKSMRQDLTVQHIQNDLTVDVYEFHAKCALESEDLNEYNQCQTQLKQLYELNLAPKSSMYEFTAYRILYYVCVQGSTKHQRGNADITALLVSLSDEAKSHPAIKHALELRRASQQENYHRLIKLYSETPNHGALIIDMVLDLWRGKALQRIVKAYKPSISIDFLVTELAFDSNEEARSFIKKGGGIFCDRSETELDTKVSVMELSKLLAKDKLLL